MPLIVHWPAGIAADQRGHDARPVRQRRRHRAHDLRAARRRRRPSRPTGSSSCRSPATRSPAALADAGRAGRQHAPVLRDGRQPGARRRRVEGGLQAPARAPTTTPSPGSCTTSPPTASECHDLAAARARAGSPTLVELWWAEAERHGVLPLDDRMIELFGARFRDRLAPPGRPPLRVPAADVAACPARRRPPSAGAASTSRPGSPRPPGDEGVLYATGTENSGICVFVQDDRLVVDYNAFDDHTVVESDVDGARRATRCSAVRFRRGDGRAGTDRPSRSTAPRPAGADLPLFMRIMSSVGAERRLRPRLGRSRPGTTPRSPFTGTLHEVVIQAQSPAAAAGTADAAAEARAEMSRQ